MLKRWGITVDYRASNITPTFKDLLLIDCGCISNSNYQDLVDGLESELCELRDALVASKRKDPLNIYVPTVNIAIEYADKITGMIIDLKRYDVQSINRLFAVVKYLIYIGGMRTKLSEEVLNELSDCGFIVNRLIGLSTNSAYTCIINDTAYRHKAYARLVKSGCIRSPRHQCKGK